MKKKSLLILLVSVIVATIPLFITVRPLAEIAVSDASEIEARVQMVLPDDL